MRKLTIGVVALLLAAVCQATPILRDPGDAWPWGAELPFPWKGIQGTWTTTINGKAIYFKFLPYHSQKGLNQLQVTEIDGDSCTMIAHGAGYEQDRVVKALMVSPAGTFNLTVHVFRQSDLVDSKIPGFIEDRSTKTVTVMSMSPLGGGVASRVTYQLLKLDSGLDCVCQIEK